MKTLALLLTLVAVGCGTREDDVRRIVREEMASAMTRKVVSPVETIGPYSPAIRLGGFLFLSGQIGLDPASGQLKNESIEVETRQVLDNVNRILQAEGYDSSDVVSATVYLKNMNDYAKMNLIYGGYFQEGNYPARTTVAVTELPRSANIEIAVVAWKVQ
jgi:2-iminobutanoate/2-iminopropanoate deaminase